MAASKSGSKYQYTEEPPPPPAPTGARPRRRPKPEMNFGSCWPSASLLHGDAISAISFSGPAAPGASSAAATRSPEREGEKMENPLIAVGEVSGRVTVYSATTGTKKHTFVCTDGEEGEEGKYAVHDLHFIGQDLFVAAGAEDAGLILTADMTAKVNTVPKIQRLDRPATAAAFSPWTNRIAVAGPYQVTVSVWRQHAAEILDNKAKESTFTVGPQISEVVWCPGGDALAVGDGHRVIVFNTRSRPGMQKGERLFEFSHGMDLVYCLSYSPCGKFFTVAGGGELNALIIRSCESGDIVEIITHKAQGDVFCSQFSPDGKLFAVGLARTDMLSETVSESGRVIVYDTGVWDVCASFFHEEGKVEALAWSHTGDQLAAGDSNQVLTVRSLSMGAQEHTFTVDEPSTIFHVQFDKRSGLLFTSGSAHSIVRRECGRCCACVWCCRRTHLTISSSVSFRPSLLHLTTQETTSRPPTIGTRLPSVGR